MKREYADHVDCSEAIAQYLIGNVPAPWRIIEASIAIEHDIEMVTSELKYWPRGEAAPKWFGIDDAEEDVEFGNCFVQLARLLRTPEQGLFQRCRFSLEPNGHYRSEYEY